MGKAKFLMALVFILTLASGLVTEVLLTRWRGADSSASGATVARTPLAQELGLSPEQNEKLRGIWEGVRVKVDDCFTRAQEAQKKRDDAILAVLNDEQKAKVAKAQRQCESELAALKADRDAAFEQAVRRTEQVLSAPQRQRYREILQSRLGGKSGEPPDWLTPATRRSGD